MKYIKTINCVNDVWLLTLPEQSGKVQNKKSCCSKSGGKELVMANNRASNIFNKSVMGFSYYCYFKACYFAGLFRRAIIPLLS